MTIDHEEFDDMDADCILGKFLFEIDFTEIFYRCLVAEHHKMRELNKMHGMINEDRFNEEDDQRTRGIAKRVAARLFKRLGVMDAYDGFNR